MPEYLILILISTIIDYTAGRLIENEENGTKKRLYLLSSIITNLGLLFVFKYFNFLNHNIHALFDYLNIPYNIPQLNILLPVGISFYTFQTLSYTIEIYKGNQKAENHFGRFALYVAFFPQLVAGPIERSYNLLPQFLKKVDFDYSRITNGLKLMAWGFFKKLVIADNISPIVNTIYNNVYSLNGLFFTIGTVLFAYQIYCDFSGYTDIARGIAKMLGFDLMKNFNRPYFSKSISEFWKRWHISLSSWFKDYVYIPLGGSRTVKWRWYYNLIITFLVSGIWHGANWTFLYWGLLHGFFMVFSSITINLRKLFSNYLKLEKYPEFQKLLKIAITFALVNFAWIFFRANNLTDATYIVTHLFTGIGDFFLIAIPYMIKHTTLQPVYNLIFLAGTSKFDLLIILIALCVLEFYHLHERKKDCIQTLSLKPVMVKWPVYIIFVMSILIFGSFNTQEFIYFQF